ncbi:MAG: DegT/DnrJ/EryC1/StrS family aminotransferase [Candidatus Solibacter usitatus]|nr:DegT/DnrJ/EryC1/StrS family aminotransferase [Candidatus Solibacter usitatus]
MKAVMRAIPVSRPELDGREEAAVSRVLRSGWITMGPETELFEAEFAAFTGAKHACAVSSGTTALHLALEATGVKTGDEVITVSHSFIATAAAIRYVGATPVFVDIDAATYNMNPALVEPALTRRTRAILCVHQMGMPCGLEALLGIARQHGLPLIEDAACAAGSEILWQGQWERIGRPRGDIACFSFHPRKVLTCGDGGMICTNDAAMERRCRALRHHGMNVGAHARHSSSSVIFESYDEPGYNYRLTDIQAAIGRVQLGKLSEMVERRRRLAGRYGRLLKNPAHEPPWARSNWQSYCMRLDEELDQREEMQRLLEAGVATRRGVMCAHREGAFPAGSWRGGSLAESEKAQDRTIMLPLFASMTEEEQDVVIEALG